MTTRYVAATGSNTSPYDTWAKAATALLTATAAMAAGDITYIDSALATTITTSTIFNINGTAANPGYVISTNDTVNMPPTTVAFGAKIDASATSLVVLTFQGNAVMCGMNIQGGGSTGAGNIIVANSGGYNYLFDTCTLQLNNTNINSRIVFGQTGGYNSSVKTVNCTIKLGNSASQAIRKFSRWDDIGSTFFHNTTQPTNLIDGTSQGNATFQGSDFSDITTIIFPDSGNTNEYFLNQCKLASGVALVGTLAGDMITVWMNDCAFGDVQYSFGHYNYYGNTISTVAIYENDADGAAYKIDDTKIGWRITGLHGTYATPYRSPWVDVYNEGVAAVTPRFEIAREGSATAYNNDVAWAEFCIKETAMVTLSTFDSSSKRGIVAAAAAQANSSKTITNWTGLGATYWLGILQPAAAVTPATIGHVRGRICVAGANTVYVNPKILGL